MVEVNVTQATTVNINADTVMVQGAAPVYGGPYSVRPKVAAQSLPTAGRLMRQDLEVQGVPIYDVSNSAGGRTAYIAKETDVEVM